MAAHGTTTSAALRTTGILLFLLPVVFPDAWCSFGDTAHLIRNALLIDGSGAAPRTAVDILIRNGRIAGIGTTDSLNTPQGAVVIDATDKTVVPGIINGRGLAGLVRSEGRPANNFTLSEIIIQLQRYASYGVTTTSTLGPHADTLARLRSEIRSGETSSAARIVTPLRALTTRSPYLDRFPDLEAVFEVVGSPDEARRAVDLLAAQGADYIEFRCDVATAASDEDRAVVEAAVVRTLHHGLRAAVVAGSESLILAAVRAGARTVAGSVVDRDASEELIATLVRTGTVYLPTLSASMVRFQYGDKAGFLDDRYLRRSLVAGVTGILRGPERVRQALDPDRALRMHQFDMARKNLRRLWAAGVTIGLASGSGFPGTFEGYSEFREAALMKRAGMSGIEVIRAFASGSAKALGIDHERGSVRTGGLADIVILNADPRENIHSLRELHAVFVGGRLVKL